MTERSRAARAFITCLAAGPPLLLLAAGIATQRKPLAEPPCWILPNARTLSLPTLAECPIQGHELITAFVVDGRRTAFEANTIAAFGDKPTPTSVEIEVMSAGQRATTSLPLRPVLPPEKRERLLVGFLITGLSLAIPLSILWTSAAPPAAAIVLICGLVATIGVGAITGRSSAAITSAIVLAACAVPSALAHLALVFPRRRRIVGASPALLPCSYVPLLLFAPLGAVALHGAPALWPPFVSLLLSLTGAAWFSVVSSCAFAIRESRSQLERARSSTLCLGAALLPIIPSILLAKGSNSVAVWLASYVVCATVTLPIPIGLAITSYNLFDVGWDTRRWVGRVIYLAGAAGLIAAGLHFGQDAAASELSAAHTFAVALAALGAAEALRTRLLSLVESMLLPHVRRLHGERERFARDVAALRDEDEVTRRLAAAVGNALAPSGGCVALKIDTAWRIAATFGDDPAACVAVARDAERFVRTRDVAHLAQEDFEADPDVQRLLSLGVELIASTHGKSASAAVLVVGARHNRKPYSGFEIDFLRILSSYAAAALENLRMASELVAAERRATTGRIAVALAHDIGKELAWISQLAERMPERAADPGRLGRDADQIAELADAALHELHEFLADSTSTNSDHRLARIDEIVELAVRQVSRRHHIARISVCLDPTLRGARAHAALTRVLANALENGVLAASGDPAVELSAQGRGKRMHLAVRDSGSGMSAETRARACEAGFTSRRARGGLGMGLTAARDIVIALGGTLGIESTLGHGTTVHVELPLAEAAR